MVNKLSVEDANAIKFKGQLLKAYILGKFPKNFCKIQEYDHTQTQSNRWRSHGDGKFQLYLRYLNRMVVDNIYIDHKNVDEDFDNYVMDSGIKVSEIPDLCSFRNTVVKCLNIPSKLSMRHYQTRLYVKHKNVEMIVDSNKISMKCSIANNIRKFVRLHNSDIPELEINLAEKYKITPEQIVTLTETSKKLFGFNTEIEKKIYNCKLEIAKFVKDELRIKCAI